MLTSRTYGMGLLAVAVPWHDLNHRPREALEISVYSSRLVADASEKTMPNQSPAAVPSDVTATLLSTSPSMLKRP